MQHLWNIFVVNHCVCEVRTTFLYYYGFLYYLNYGKLGFETFGTLGQFVNHPEFSRVANL